MSTALRLTPTIKQGFSQRNILATKLLQLPCLSLDQRIAEELEINPVLEWNQNIDSELGNLNETDENIGQEDDFLRRDREQEFRIDDNGNNNDDFEIADDFSSLYSDTIDEQPARSQDWLENEASRRHDMLENIPAHEETLQRHLMEQLSWAGLDPQKRKKCEQIINNLDQNGYLLCSLDDLVSQNNDYSPLSVPLSLVDSTPFPNVPKVGRKKSVVSTPKNSSDDLKLETIPIVNNQEKKEYEEALSFVQTLDPKGIGARNLKECLLLQVRPGNPYEKEVRTLIENHLEKLAKNSYSTIAKETGFCYERIQNAALEIKQLNPRPGAVYSQESVPTIVPDVYADLGKDGSIIIRIDDSRDNGLTINPDYMEILKNRKSDPETKNYLRKNIGSAKWFIDAIEQRKLTLIRVVQAILTCQKDFLTQGPAAIRPLTRRQIADKLGIHGSTVSRAVQYKWIQTPQGLFPLETFFPKSSLSVEDDNNDKDDLFDINDSDNNNNDDELIQKAACSKVQDIISKENKAKPLSDDAIALLMKKEGIQISRRTVTKYRDIMDIPDSRKRRVWS